MVKVSLYSNWTYRSNSDLFYCPDLNGSDDSFLMTGEETHHLVNVMKYRAGDCIHVTNGLGKVSSCRIESVKPQKVELAVIEVFTEARKHANIVFCLPYLKSLDRLEFAFEKLIELGFSRFIFFRSDRSVKKNVNSERLNKIGLHAMKQSLHAWKPEIAVIQNLELQSSGSSEVILFDQEGELAIDSFKPLEGIDYYLVFGPEGGLSDAEVNKFAKNGRKYRLIEQRLRSETAILYAGMAVSLNCSI